MIAALMPNYNRAPIGFTHGQGVYLFDTEGRRYLDFGAGIATSSLGHAHPQLVAAIAEQAGRVIHVSNLYQVAQAETLAARLVAASFADTVFFCNSGAEANEALVKAMRKTMADAGRPERQTIICFEGAFHGRTLAMISATGNAKYLAGFEPRVAGFVHVNYNDIEAVQAAIGPQVAGVLVEPIQGEGGVRVAAPGFLAGLRALCDTHGIMLGLDEVQCGMGRTGRLFAHEWAGIAPDVMSLAKGIAGGVPMGAVLATERVGRALVPGSHGTTFGGGPLACAAGNAVLEVVLAPGFLQQVQDTAAYFAQGLEALCQNYPSVFGQVRGQGFLRGLLCKVANGTVQTAALAQGLLVVAAGDNVIRLMPPLIVSIAECEAALALLERAAQCCLPAVMELAK